MLETVMKHGIIFYVIGILMAAGVLAKLVSYITARKLVKAASDIQKSNQRLMRLVKAKFEHASMVSDKVQNVEAFVKKYLYEYKVFGARLSSWQYFPFKMVWLIITLGLAGAMASFRTVGMEEQTLRYGAFAAIYAVLLVSIHILSDEKTKLDAAKNYMVEYLENVCVHRYEKAGQAVRAVREEGQKVDMASGSAEELKEAASSDMAGAKAVNAEQDAVTNPTGSVVQAVEEPAVSNMEEDSRENDMKNEQEMRIRAILEEFLA